jgi:hypothetical protein
VRVRAKVGGVSSTVVGVVRGTGARWPGALEVQVDLPGRGPVLALAYPALVGEPQVGDRAVVTTAALDRGLGTGGWAFVVHVEGRLAPEAPPEARQVKARYTPQQVLVTGVEEDERTRQAMQDCPGLEGMPVVVAELHSALPAVLAGLRADRADLRAVYVMTDGGALPLWFSRTVADLRAAGWLAATVTCGQAFGGELEAVSLHSALVAARAVAAADVAVVAPGPGTAGTASVWGFSGVAAGEAVNAAAAVGGRPVACVRISGADPRERHRGLSHHSVTAYGRVALAAADVPLPAAEAAALADAVVHDLLAGRHRLVPVDASGLAEALAGCPCEPASMGRPMADDPRYYLAAAAAGRHGAALLTSRR